MSRPKGKEIDLVGDPPSAHKTLPSREPGPSLRSLAAPFSAYLVLAAVATYPLLFRLGDHVCGEGSPPLNVWAIGFVLHQLPRDPVHLFDGNAFYPYHRSLAFSEHLVVPALLSSPALAVTRNLVASYNLTVLLTLALSGLGMFLFARELTGDQGAAFVAGMFYAFHTWNINETSRLQILSSEFFPLLMLALVRFFRDPGLRRGLLCGLLYALQSLSCMYWALYLPIVVGSTVGVLQWRRPLPWRVVRRLIAGLGPGLVVAGIFALPYVEAARELGFERKAPSPVLINRWGEVLPESLLYRHVLGTGQPNENAAHFLGFVALGLALCGILGRRGEASSLMGLRGLFLGFVVVGFLLSLGPQLKLGQRILCPGPYALLWRLVPGFRHVRYPERFSLFVILGLAPFVADGLAWLRPRLGPAATFALGALVFLEHLSVPRPLSFLPTGKEVPEVYRWLAHQSDVRVIAEVPSSRMWMERADGLPMYLSTFHWKRTVQGFTGYFPPTYTFLKWRLFHFPEAESVDFLRRLGVDTIVVGPEKVRALARAGAGAGWGIVGPFPEGHVALRLPQATGEAFSPPIRDDGSYEEVDRAGWKVEASSPGAALAIDGDPNTWWGSVDDPQAAEDYYGIRLRRSLPVARLSMRLVDPFGFPAHLQILGAAEGQGLVELPFDRRATYDRLFQSLLFRPREARFTIDLHSEPIRVLRLRISQSDAYGMPWAMSEIHLYTLKPEAGGGLRPPPEGP